MSDEPEKLTYAQVASKFNWRVTFDMAAARVAAELAAKDAEIVRLRELHAGACDRIVAQSALLSKVAERDALARLEAWLNEDEAGTRSVTVSRLFGYVGLHDGCKEKQARAYHSPGCMESWCGKPRSVTYCGTDAKPASLSETILAALALWAEIHGAAEGLRR